MSNPNHALANLRLLLEAYANCELPQWEFFAANVRMVRMSAGATLFNAGEAHSFVYFVHRGLMKAVAIDENGRASTTYFYEEGDVLASLSALGVDGIRRVATRGLHSRARVISDALERRTLHSAVAVEPTQLFQTPFKVVEHLASQHLPWARLMYTVALMQATIQRADLTWMRATPEQRYRRVLAESPDLVRRVTQRHPHKGIGPLQPVADGFDVNIGQLAAVFVGNTVEDHGEGARPSAGRLSWHGSESA